MTIQRMDHVAIVVDDLPAATAFFLELGMKKDGEAPISGRWVDRINGLDDVQVDLVVLDTPDGSGRLELKKFNNPEAVATDSKAPPNTLGLRHLTYVVDDVDDAVERLHPHGAELVGEIAEYEDIYRYVYVRGPGGSIIGLVEELRRGL